MFENAFASLPDDAHVWIYAFDKQLNSEQEVLVKASLDQFIAEWQSHGAAVDGNYLIVEGRFVIIAGHCTDGISGCSIDSKVRVFKELHEVHGLNALGGTRIFFRNPKQQIEFQDRGTFKRMLQEGTIEKNASIFDLSARTVAELKASPIERPLAESWAYRAFAGSIPSDTNQQGNVL